MTQGRMALYGGIDAHQLMTRDTRTVAELTDSVLSALAANGGYIAAPDQVLPFPEENLETMRERVRRFDPSASRTG